MATTNGCFLKVLVKLYPHCVPRPMKTYTTCLSNSAPLCATPTGVTGVLDVVPVTDLDQFVSSGGRAGAQVLRNNGLLLASLQQVLCRGRPPRVPCGLGPLQGAVELHGHALGVPSPAAVQPSLGLELWRRRWSSAETAAKYATATWCERQIVTQAEPNSNFQNFST